MTSSDLSPRSVRLLAALVLIVTFAAGAAAGAGLSRWLGRDLPGPPPPFLGSRIVEELGLSEEQHQKAWLMAEKRRPELEAILRETFPRVRVLNEQMEQEFEQILTAEQRERFEHIKERRSHEPPPFGLPPPGRPSSSGRDWPAPEFPGAGAPDDASAPRDGVMPRLGVEPPDAGGR